MARGTTAVSGLAGLLFLAFAFVFAFGAGCGPAVAPDAAGTDPELGAEQIAAAAVCDGIGDWTLNGCRGNGCAVCQEKLSSYNCYFQNHPACVPNLTCSNTGY